MNLLEIVGIVTIIALIIGGTIGRRLIKNWVLEIVFGAAAMVGLALAGLQFLIIEELWGTPTTWLGTVLLVLAGLMFIVWLIWLGSELGKLEERKKNEPRLGD